MVKTAAVVGPNVEMGDVKEAIHLKRLLRLYSPGAEGGERWESEADPRHVEILVSQMGLSNESKAVSTRRSSLLPIVDDAGQLSQ